MSDSTLIEAKGIHKIFTKGKESFIAVNNVSLEIEQGKCYGLVGESGSGKSTLALAMMLLQPPEIGDVFYQGQNITQWGASQIRTWRQDCRMLFQHPEAVLNPGMKISALILEGLNRTTLTKAEKQKRLDETLVQCRIDTEHLNRYPSNLSAGEKQRVAIARALITQPKFLVCDEPVASLDLSIQTQILALLKELQQELGLTYLFISHNLPMVQLLSDKIGVMYMGNLVEEAPASQFTLDGAKHPYSRLLLASVPEAKDNAKRQAVLEGFADEEPERLDQGCPFRNRCDLYSNEAESKCDTILPAFNWKRGGHGSLP